MEHESGDANKGGRAEVCVAARRGVDVKRRDGAFDVAIRQTANEVRDSARRRGRGWGEREGGKREEKQWPRYYSVEA